MSVLNRVYRPCPSVVSVFVPLPSIHRNFSISVFAFVSCPSSFQGRGASPGQTAKVIDQETVEKTVQFHALRVR